MNFSGYDCTIELTQYAHNGQKAMQLYDANDGEPIARATVCIDYDFQENQTAIKDWSENETIMDIPTFMKTRN